MKRARRPSIGDLAQRWAIDAAGKWADAAVDRLASGRAPLAVPIVVCDRCVCGIRDWRARLGVMVARGVCEAARLPLRRVATCERCAVGDDAKPGPAGGV